MKYTVSGDLLVPFVIQIEAATEAEAEHFVANMNPANLYEFRVPGPHYEAVAASVHYAEPVDLVEEETK